MTAPPGLAAARGHQPLALLEWGMSNATERGEGSAVAGGFWLTALLRNGHGQYAEALTAARRSGSKRAAGGC